MTCKISFHQRVKLSTIILSKQTELTLKMAKDQQQLKEEETKSLVHFAYDNNLLGFMSFEFINTTSFIIVLLFEYPRAINFSKNTTAYSG